MFKTIAILTLLAASAMGTTLEGEWPEVNKAVGVVPEWYVSRGSGFDPP
jgi:hypothetical protein